ncbi:response regulator [Xanthomonas graminis]|jgi:two-component system sensor histidine kinase RpfC|uniref:Sensory/regulatory protein RpfC n=1 Tax=Xanthomonas graminis pv. graminis TaxID=134874 RepID=A0A1M4IKR8_9XANT|nr:response regulator [Xanthomonas translucens]EKU24727.1 Sensory/regulatory protein RpfC [Xanthomonas translucens pv. graminis ART-Xtg29]OAX59570.1 hybrid sensor histidine kinase/response regulator [Xanthomonas translucens pv. graminis]UKE55964.1 response regulator [Xanthomonas translucens pv. graminis]WIH10288.1 response regulator [Xanthomonas translucens pv. graminis]WIH13682.1 response regulator [Xanthomonas translucens pv. graminis]
MTSAIAWLRHRLGQCKDTEHAQALVRILLISIILSYVFLPGPRATLPLRQYLEVVAVVASGLVLSFGVLLWLLWRPERSDLRRIIGMIADYGLIACAMVGMGEPLAWMYVVVMWVTVGNGLRYGTGYLYLAVAMGVLSFGTTVLVTPYWRENILLGIGLLIGLLAVPLYLSGLLRQLTSATKEAQRANEAKSRFLANMSHEFRTPLNGLSGMTELLSATKLDAEQRECVSTIQASARSLLSLVEEVLDISAIEAGKVRINKSEFSLREIVDQIGLILQPQARSKAIGYHVEIGPDVPDRLSGDVGHLRQILLNLAGNAVKFTELGRIDIRVRLLKIESGLTWLSFDIVDTGIGVPVSMRSRLFDAFEQADVGMARRYEGTGLGTTIAKGLVESMGGSIGYQENPPCGSRFWFDLPFVVSGFAAVAVDAQISAMPSEELQQTGNVIAFSDPFLRHRARVRGMRILVADDHAANRMVLQRMLQKAGHRAICVDGAEAVLDALAESEFDAVIVDLHMPGMSGLDMLKQLRVMQAGGPRTPVVVLSADVTPESIQRCEQAGAHTFLAKPLAANRLLDTLTDIATDGKLRGANETSARPLAASIEGVLDPSVLDELAGLGMGEGFEREFISQCLNDAEGCLGGMQVAGDDEHWERLREHAHAIKGVASNLGLVKLASLGGELMQMPDWQMRSEWRQRLMALNASLTQGREALELRARRSAASDGGEIR